MASQPAIPLQNFPLKRPAEMVRGKEDDVSQSVRNKVHIYLYTVLPTTVLGGVGWLVSWLCMNVIQPATDSFTKQGPQLMQQSLAVSTQLADIVQQANEEKQRQRLFDENRAEQDRTQIDLLRRIDARIKP